MPREVQPAHSCSRLTPGEVWTSRSGQVKWLIKAIHGDRADVENVRTGLAISIGITEFLEHMKEVPDGV